MANAKEAVRLAAVGDIHCTKTSQGDLEPLFSKIAETADVLLLCGDLTGLRQKSSPNEPQTGFISSKHVTI